MRLLTLPAVLLATGCACDPERIPVPAPVPVETVRYVPIPAGLLDCEDTGPYPPKGAPLAELFAWSQRTRAAAVECQARLAEARGLGR